MWIDSHCHLDGHRFDEDREAVIARALAAGVTKMLGIGTGDGPPDLDVAIRLAEKYPFLWATAGVHPHDAAKWTPDCAPTLRDRAAALRHRTRTYHTFLQVIALSALAGAPLTLIALPHLSAHPRMNQCQEMVQKMAIIEGRYMTSDEARLNCEVARDRGR